MFLEERGELWESYVLRCVWQRVLQCVAVCSAALSLFRTRESRLSHIHESCHTHTFIYESRLSHTHETCLTDTHESCHTHTHESCLACQ